MQVLINWSPVRQLERGYPLSLQVEYPETY